MVQPTACAASALGARADLRRKHGLFLGKYTVLLPLPCQEADGVMHLWDTQEGWESVPEQKA